MPRLCRMCICLIIFLFIYIFFHNFISPCPSHSKNLSDSTDSRIIRTIRKCLNHLDTDDQVDSFMKSFSRCLRHLPDFKTLKIRKNKTDNAEIFLPLRRSFNESHCIWLTMGIGGNTDIEEEFKKKYPKCKFYGIEAGEGQFGSFEKFGKLITLAVGKLILRKYSRYNLNIYEYPF